MRSYKGNVFFKKAGFIPLEKAHEVVGGEYQGDAGVLKPPPSITVRDRSSVTGFTLVEILISVAIMAIALTSTLQILNYLIQLNEANDVSILCTNVAQGMMDEINEVTYEDIVSEYNNFTFTLDELTARNIPHMGVVYAQEIEAGSLTDVKVVICYQAKNRIYGEDRDFNGTLNGGEDLNGNGQIDSPCMVTSTIVYRYGG